MRITLPQRSIPEDHSLPFALLVRRLSGQPRRFARSRPVSLRAKVPERRQLARVGSSVLDRAVYLDLFDRCSYD